MIKQAGKAKTNNMDYEHLYQNGLPFNKELKENLDQQLAQRINNNFPSLLLIDGGQGQGKTTLMVHIIDYINKKHGFPECRLGIKDHPQISLGGKEFIKNFNICRKEGLPILGYDEAGDFSRRGSISRFNAMLNRRFETFRSSNIIIVLALPNFNILDNHLFDLQVPRGLLHLQDRQRTIKYGNYYAYSLYAMNWIRHWFEKLPKAIRHQCYSKTTSNFKGQFKNLPPEREKKLGNLSDYGKTKESMEAEIRLEGLMTYKDLALKVNRSIKWCRKFVYDNKVKAAKVGPMRVKYFSPETIDRMMDYIDTLRGIK